MSPFEALYEYKPPAFTTVSLPCNISEEAQVTLAEKDKRLKVMHQNLTQAHQRMKTYVHQNRIERVFEQGDMLYLKMQPYPETTLGLRNSLKLTSKWYDPFRILDKVGHVAYRLQLSEGTQLNNCFM